MPISSLLGSGRDSQPAICKVGKVLAGWATGSVCGRYFPLVWAAGGGERARVGGIQAGKVLFGAGGECREKGQPLVVERNLRSYHYRSHPIQYGVDTVYPRYAGLQESRKGCPV